MADESDGVEEVFEAALRVALTVAGRVAEQAARAREQAARDAQAASGQQGRELQTRLDAERSAARAQLAVTERPQWWAAAEPDQVAGAWQTARAWQDLDPDARVAADRIRTEVRDRYGVDVDEPRAEPGALADALAARQGAGRDAQQQRQQRRSDEVEAALLLAQADRADRGQQPAAAVGARQDAGVLYDSAERRQDLADRLESVADAEAVQARVLADTSQGKPAVDAVAAAPGTGPKARRSRGVGSRVKQQQQALDR